MPPSPPEIKPKVRLTWMQRLGFPIFLALPILALFRVFGESQAAAHVTGSALEVTVSYPSRMHYRQLQSLRVTVRNLSPAEADTVKVSFDTAYISRFTSVRFSPVPRTAYVVDLANVKPLEARLVSVEFEGESYGRHTGTIVARHGSDSTVVHLGTRVFP